MACFAAGDLLRPQARAALRHTIGIEVSPKRFKILNGILLLLSTPADVVRTNLFTDFGVASIRFLMAM